MLIAKLQTVNITTKQATDNADVLIIETAIDESKLQKTAVIIGEDIDLLVSLIGRTLSHQQEIFFKKVAFEKQNCPVQSLFESGVRTLLAIYNAPKSENCIDRLRYAQFIKLTKLNKPVQLSTLPPTSAAALQHFNRVYYQVQTWLGHDLEPQNWGWIMRKEFLEPVMTMNPPAPEELLNKIFCNCKNGCGSRCGCRKAGLQCSLVCGQCNGQACLNALPYQSDLNEDGTFDPEILEELETNVVEDENAEEFEIVQPLEDDDDEEEEEN
ncbi:hypothetical protein M0804_004931 [Polistes exclamans]|nr:hypothetical protein M0804_004931 [Polistes exclamans]